MQVEISGGNILGLATSVVTLFGVLANMWLQRSTQKKLAENTVLTQKVSEQTDGLTSQLVLSRAEAEHAKGKLEGVGEGAVGERDRLASMIASQRLERDEKAEEKKTPQAVVVVNESTDAVPVVDASTAPAMTDENTKKKK